METIEDLKYLTNKKVLLSSPGYAINDLYYSNSDSVVETTECTFSTGRYKQSLNNANWGSTSQLTIPNSSFVGDVYLNASLSVPVGAKIGGGFLYSAIQSVSFLFGSSNVPQLILSGQSIQELAMLECDTQEKRDEVMSLAGEPLDNSAGSVPVTRTATALIPLPFSSLCGYFCKKPFDTNILQNPIIVQISFNSYSSVITGGTPTVGFLKAQCLLRQGDLTNKSESLRNALRLNPDRSLNYPFIHHQSFNPPQFTGIPSLGVGVNSPACTVVLQGLINADLVAMSFHVVKTADISTNANPFNYDPITNIRVLYNGMVLYDCPDDMYKLVNMGGGSLGSTSFNYILATPFTPPIGPAKTTVKSYPILVNFSRLKSLIFTNHFSNVFRIPNNTLSVEFNTSTNDQFNCFVTYHYNAIAMIENGQANLYFD